MNPCPPRHSLRRVVGTLVLLTSLCSPQAQLPLDPPVALNPLDQICALPLGDRSSGIVQPEGTLRMIERLKKVHLDLSAQPHRAAFMSTEMAAFLEDQLRAAMAANDAKAVLALQPQLALQLLQAGQSERALRTFRGFHKNAMMVGHQFDARQASQLNLLLSLCYLRIGEQENCLENHTSQSCLIPIGPGGVHRLPRGSQEAIKVLTSQLEREPRDLQARWLLNIAHMTLGTYPESVPAQHLVPPAVFKSDYDIKRFPEVAQEAGLAVDDLAGGSAVDDFDGDGLLDVMASSWAMDGQLRFFKNNGDGTFTERTAAAGLNGLVSGLHIVHTDYNNDGWTDLLVLRGAWLMSAGKHPNSLLKNRGDGTFEDVTEAAGLLSFHPTQAAAWFDFDGDGWLDLYIGNESLPQDPHPSELFRNNRDGTFTEMAMEAGVAVTQYIKGVTSADFNNDGRPDLYLSNRTGPNLLFRNDGPREDGKGWKFTEIAAAAGVTEPKASFPTWFWDFDNDGWMDIFVAGYHIRGVGDVAADYLGLPHSGERSRLFKNNRDGTFTDVTSAAGLYKVLHAMGSNFGDLDNDGWLDFYLGTGDPNLETLIPNRMFRNAGGKSFQDVTTSGGFGHIQKGHGVSFADLDNDGDQDIHVVMGGAYTGDNYRNALFENPGHGNRWVTLRLEGVKSNRPAIGARIRVDLETAEGQRTIYRTVGTGGSFGANPLRQEIGLGQALAIRSVEVHWPTTGETQVFRDLDMNRFYDIREGDETPVLLNPKRFQIGAGRVAQRSGQHPHVVRASGGL